MSLSNTCFLSPQVNEKFLVYTNVLIYSPRKAADRVVRMEQATIPVECHFGRLQNIDINWEMTCICLDDFIQGQHFVPLNHVYAGSVDMLTTFECFFFLGSLACLVMLFSQYGYPTLRQSLLKKAWCLTWKSWHVSDLVRQPVILDSVLGNIWSLQFNSISLICEAAFEAWCKIKSGCPSTVQQFKIILLAPVLFRWLAAQAWNQSVFPRRHDKHRSVSLGRTSHKDEGLHKQLCGHPGPWPKLST